MAQSFSKHMCLPSRRTQILYRAGALWSYRGVTKRGGTCSVGNDSLGSGLQRMGYVDPGVPVSLDIWRCTHPWRSVIWGPGVQVWVSEQRVIHISHHPRNQLPHVQTRRRGSISHVGAILRPDRQESREPRKEKESKKREGGKGKEQKGGTTCKTKEERDINREQMQKRCKTVVGQESSCGDNQASLSGGSAGRERGRRWLAPPQTTIPKVALEIRSLWVLSVLLSQFIWFWSPERGSERSSRQQHRAQGLRWCQSSATRELSKGQGPQPPRSTARDAVALQGLCWAVWTKETYFYQNSRVWHVIAQSFSWEAPHP